MASKSSAKAPSNIAFVKYWGKTNNSLTLPANSSISMSLADLWTKTTVEFSDDYRADQVELRFYGEKPFQATGSKLDRVVHQLDYLRSLAGDKRKAKVVSENNFPAGAGIASSASGFCALTLAAAQALKISHDPKELSILVRMAGSGSACRSVYGGFVEWKKGNSSESSYAIQLKDEQHWPLYDFVLVISDKEKPISTLEGHDLAHTSPYFAARMAEMPKRLKTIREAIAERDLEKLGLEIEREAVSLHMMAMTSVPPVWYWLGGTIEAVHEVFALRAQGVAAYWTMDAGPNVHIICSEDALEKLQQVFSQAPYVQEIFVSKIGNGATIINQHLF